MNAKTSDIRLIQKIILIAILISILLLISAVTNSTLLYLIIVFLGCALAGLQTIIILKD
ncbi:MAG: hypothetical protein R2728_16205 [Chitinophagales bacterium]